MTTKNRRHSPAFDPSLSRAPDAVGRGSVPTADVAAGNATTYSTWESATELTDDRAGDGALEDACDDGALEGGAGDGTLESGPCDGALEVGTSASAWRHSLTQVRS